VREVRYARGGTDGVMHVCARTRELVFVRIKYFDGGNAYSGYGMRGWCSMYRNKRKMKCSIRTRSSAVLRLVFIVAVAVT
jgi:hypothetical protein